MLPHLQKNNLHFILQWGLISGVIQFFCFYFFIFSYQKNTDVQYYFLYQGGTLILWNIFLLISGILYLKKNPFSFRILFSFLVILSLISFLTERFGMILLYFVWPQIKTLYITACEQGMGAMESFSISPELLSQSKEACQISGDFLFSAGGFFKELPSKIIVYSFYGLFLSSCGWALNRLLKK